MTTRREFSNSVKFTAWRRAAGHCEKCRGKLFTGHHEYHHDRECAFDGDATLSNCLVLCTACHSAITKQRAPVIAKSNRIRNRNIGIKKPRRHRWGYGKDDPFKKKITGEVVRRERYCSSGGGHRSST